MSQFHFDPATYLDLMRQEVPAYGRLQDVVAEASEGRTVTRVLDLGTGTGETLAAVLARHPGARAVGVDQSAPMLEAARARLAGLPVELVVAELADPLPAGPFDLVVSALAVHHLEGPDKAALFARVAEALRPGGRFVLGDVVVPSRPRRRGDAVDQRPRPALDGRRPVALARRRRFRCGGRVVRARPRRAAWPTGRAESARPLSGVTMTPPAEATPSAGEESLHRALGLTDDEFEAVAKILGRPPNHLELALYAVMWSEHCSYKSSRLHLRRLPTEGPRVLVGPGENAGVIDAGRRHRGGDPDREPQPPLGDRALPGGGHRRGRHPARHLHHGRAPARRHGPALLRPPDDARQRWLVEGVVSGISGYGNSVGVPTVGGELTFDPCYAQNPLVNVLCMGALPTERLVLGIASGPGNLAVLLGSSTGRDGIGGVSVLASAGFSGRGRRRPTTPSDPASRWATPSRRSA